MKLIYDSRAKFFISDSHDSSQIKTDVSIFWLQ